MLKSRIDLSKEKKDETINFKRVSFNSYLNNVSWKQQLKAFIQQIENIIFILVGKCAYLTLDAINF